MDKMDKGTPLGGKKAKTLVFPDDGDEIEKTKRSTTSKTNELVARLINEWNFVDTELARTFANNGVAEALFALEQDKNVKISEDDPLLIISVDLENLNSIAYVNQGNGAPPVLPANYTAPPHALGTFIGTLPGVQEKGGGSYLIFLVDTLGSLIESHLF